MGKTYRSYDSEDELDGSETPTQRWIREGAERRARKAQLDEAAKLENKPVMLDRTEPAAPTKLLEMNANELDPEVAARKGPAVNPLDAIIRARHGEAVAAINKKNPDPEVEGGSDYIPQPSDTNVPGEMDDAKVESVRMGDVPPKTWTYPPSAQKTTRVKTDVGTRVVEAFGDKNPKPEESKPVSAQQTVQKVAPKDPVTGQAPPAEQTVASTRSQSNGDYSKLLPDAVLAESKPVESANGDYSKLTPDRDPAAYRGDGDYSKLLPDTRNPTPDEELFANQKLRESDWNRFNTPDVTREPPRVSNYTFETGADLPQDIVAPPALPFDNTSAPPQRMPEKLSAVDDILSRFKKARSSDESSNRMDRASEFMRAGFTRTAPQASLMEGEKPGTAFSQEYQLAQTEKDNDQKNQANDPNSPLSRAMQDLILKTEIGAKMDPAVIRRTSAKNLPGGKDLFEMALKKSLKGDDEAKAAAKRSEQAKVAYAMVDAMLKEGAIPTELGATMKKNPNLTPKEVTDYRASGRADETQRAKNEKDAADKARQEKSDALNEAHMKHTESLGWANWKLAQDKALKDKPVSEGEAKMRSDYASAAAGAGQLSDSMTAFYKKFPNPLDREFQWKAAEAAAKQAPNDGLLSSVQDFVLKQVATGSISKEAAEAHRDLNSYMSRYAKSISGAGVSDTERANLYNQLSRVGAPLDAFNSSLYKNVETNRAGVNAYIEAESVGGRGPGTLVPNPLSPTGAAPPPSAKTGGFPKTLRNGTKTAKVSNAEEEAEARKEGFK